MSSLAAEAFPSAANLLLEQLCARKRPVVDCHDVMVIVAHPDDETIAIGGQLDRMKGVRLLHVTDGAPSNMEDALACGFACSEDYADARRAELAAAMALAGVDERALISFNIVDQSVAFRMAELAPQLAAVLQEGDVRTVVTHAYEGGHPDHDATAFIVHAACHLLARDGFAEPAVIEFPLYHARHGAMVVQEFAPGQEQEGACAITLGKAAAERKKRMLAEYITQRRTLAPFGGQVERFQPAPEYDFGALPNGGDLFYEHFDWGLRPAAWPILVARACRDLGLPRCL